MKCDCATTVNEKLKDINLRLNCEAFVMPGLIYTLTLQTEWIDKTKAPKGRKNNPPAINITYCPFCGKLVDYSCEKKSGDTIPDTGASTSAADGKA